MIDATRPKLFQFWNTERGPEEVETLMQTWAEDSRFDYQRFTKETADAFIKTNFDKRTVAAYRKCGVPAMQADFFRYCALFAEGGIYIDADTENSGRLHELLEGREHGLLMTRETRVANDFLFVRTAGAELYEKTIKRAVENVESETSNNVWVVTGPGIMTRFYSDPNQLHLFETYDIEPARVVREYVLFRHSLNYKKSTLDWRSKIDNTESSIFLQGQD